MSDVPCVHANWPAPRGVHAFTTLRHGAGASPAPFDTFNLGNKFAADGDAPARVDANRKELVHRFALPSTPHWLRQVHGIDVLRFDARPAGDASEPTADASVTSTPDVVLAILTADCMPVVFAARDGSEVAAAHAGWRGLLDGVLEATLAAMRAPAEDVIAWIGPAAGPERYEVGVDVYDAFVSRDWSAASAFRCSRPDHWFVDLYALARQRLQRAGVEHVYGGDFCTISDEARFFSHRRDRRTGRMATLVWRED